MSKLELAPLSPTEAGELFSSFTRPWWIAGGWALDLFLGAETRAHEDIEIALLREDQLAVRDHLRDWDLRYALKGELHEWPAGELLEPPVHGIWARPRGSTAWTLELLLNERGDDRWVYRRDPRVTLPLRDAGVVSPSGLPVFAPEIVLLYKSRDARDKDDADFRAVLPRLGASQRAWLAAALDPSHAWRADLT